MKEVGVTRFERATSWSQTKRSSQAELHPVKTKTANSLIGFAVRKCILVHRGQIGNDDVVRSLRKRILLAERAACI